MKPKLPHIATILLSLTTVALLAIPVLFDQQVNAIKRHTNTLQQNIYQIQNSIHKTEGLWARAQAQQQHTQHLIALNVSAHIIKDQTQQTQDLIHQTALSAIQTADPNRQNDLSTALNNINSYDALNEICDRYLSEAHHRVLQFQNQQIEYNKTQITLETRRTHWLIGCVAFLTIGLALALLADYWN